MSYEDVRARLNLHAVLPNLEDVVADDPEMHALVADTRIVVKFNVTAGPKAWVRLAGGACAVGAGSPLRESPSLPSVVLAFTSAAHLNKMFDGRGNPIPVWGFTHLGFLQGPFTELTDRMAYYLTPTAELLAHAGYLEMNTRLTLNTAAFAIPQLLAADPECRALAHGIVEGTVVIKVLPDGPAVSLICGRAGVRPVKEELPHPSALINLPDLQTANDFLSGKLDLFAAVAKGDIEIWGRINLVDTIGLVLDRVGTYLQPEESAAAVPAS